MIKILPTDTIVDVVNKINECKEDEILIEFPYGHNILNNYLSLKILKNKARNKKITILNNDPSSKKIGESIGINYSIIKDKDFLKEKNFKQEILKHNYTFLEYFIFVIKKYFTSFVNYLGRKAKIDTLKYYNPYNKVKKTGVVFLFTGLLVSIGMLFFIFYFAVSKTYINITPEITIQTKATNITYEELPGELSILSKDLKVPLKKMTQTVKLSYTHKTTGIDYEKTGRSSGEVEFINELREEQTFRPKTRVLSKDGFIYETTDWIKIPGRTTNGSGETLFGVTKRKVIAQLYDTDGNFVGSKGNLKGENLFTIPGLKFSQDKIYAKQVGEFVGGQDNVVYMVGDDDLENSKKILEEMLKKEAINTLKNTIDEENKIYLGKYEILPIKDILQYKNLEISTTPEKIKPGDKIDTFTLNGTITVEAYVYDKNVVLNLLKNIINDSLLTGTDKLIMIDENSIKMTLVLDKQTNPLRIKATTEVNIGVSYDFDNNASNYNQRLKTMILGLSNDEAKNILLNEGKISDIEIKNTPFFINTISSNIDNIILKIVSD
ncbi:hypothetical protein H3C61_04165 [Candidatus Gracilibacteria bacterium]|nr:hypothetical protein [Candidatus Gracilibacteria bacterium]